MASRCTQFRSFDLGVHPSARPGSARLRPVPSRPNSLRRKYLVCSGAPLRFSSDPAQARGPKVGLTSLATAPVKLPCLSWNVLGVSRPGTGANVFQAGQSVSIERKRLIRAAWGI